jgi:dihydroxy-acid dehydratase
VGKPLALVKDADIIEIDAVSAIPAVQLSDDEFEKRKKSWKPRETIFTSGALAKVARLVGAG